MRRESAAAGRTSPPRAPGRYGYIENVEARRTSCRAPHALPASAGPHFDATGPQLRALGNTHGEHAVLEVRVYLLGLELVAEHESPSIDRGADVGIQRLHLVLRRDADAPFDEQVVAIDAQVQPVLRHARHVRAQRHAVLGFEDVDGRPQCGLRRRGTTVLILAHIAIGWLACDLTLVVHGGLHL